MGGDFANGAWWGAGTAAAGYTFNELHHEIFGKYEKSLHKKWNGRHVGRETIDAFKMGGKDLYRIATEEGPLPKIALGVAAATTVGPAIVAGGYYAAPVIMPLAIESGIWIRPAPSASIFMGGAKAAWRIIKWIDNQAYQD